MLQNGFFLFKKKNHYGPIYNFAHWKDLQIITQEPRSPPDSGSEFLKTSFYTHTKETVFIGEVVDLHFGIENARFGQIRSFETSKIMTLFFVWNFLWVFNYFPRNGIYRTRVSLYSYKMLYIYVCMDMVCAFMCTCLHMYAYIFLFLRDFASLLLPLTYVNVSYNTREGHTYFKFYLFERQRNRLTTTTTKR